MYAKRGCMYNKRVGIYGNLTFRFVLLRFVSMLNYGISSVCGPHFH